MKRAAIIAALICAVVALFVLCSCPRHRFGSFTDADWRTIHKKVEALCAVYSGPTEWEDGEDVPAVSGSKIPESLRYLGAERVWLRPNSVTISFYHTPAGDDTIDVDCDKSGVCRITIHEGSWMNEPREVWTSKKKEANQQPDPTRMDDSQAD